MSKYEGHTAGPWHLHREDTIFDSSDECVAVSFIGEANARLIADAPMLLRQRDDLLNRLKESTDMLENIMYGQDLDDIEEQISDNQSAIIQCEELERNA